MKPVASAQRKAPSLLPAAPWAALLWLWAAGAPALTADAPLAAVLAAVEREGAAARVVFVAAAVEAMAAFHNEVVADARRRGDDPDPRWIEAIRSFVADLRSARAAAERGAEVRFVAHDDGQLRVLIGSRPAHQFMLTPPRPDDSARLARAVVARYCELSGCAPKAVDRLARAAVTPSRGGVAPPRSAPVQSADDDGLSCAGDLTRHRRLQELACTRLIGELRAVATALAASRQPVEWDAIGKPARTQDGHELVVTRAGTRVRLAMPALFAAPHVLHEALPWMRAVLEGRAARFAVTPPPRMVYGAALAASSVP